MNDRLEYNCSNFGHDQFGSISTMKQTINIFVTQLVSTIAMLLGHGNVMTELYTNVGS